MANNFAFAQAIHQPRLLKKIGPFELNKALLTMGFGTWGALEPGEDYCNYQLLMWTMKYFIVMQQFVWI